MAHSERPQWDKEDGKPNHPPDKGGTKSSSREALNHVCIPETSQCPPGLRKPSTIKDARPLKNLLFGP